MEPTTLASITTTTTTAYNIFPSIITTITTTSPPPIFTNVSTTSSTNNMSPSSFNLSNNNETYYLDVDGNTTLVDDVDYKEVFPHGKTMTLAMTVIYLLITVTGVVGNVATCVVIVRNRVMHTATNYYLFSMAISDLLLLGFGMPDELYMLWRGSPYIFGAEFCFIRGFTAEISTNASILCIAAFTVERYIGICHPLRSHTMSQLGRVVRSIAVIWIVATACAIPIAIQYGIDYNTDKDGNIIPESSACLIKKRIYMAFEVSSILFFVAPLLLITVLYVLIAVQLKQSSRLTRAVPSITAANSSSTNDGSRNKAVIKMLVAVVIAFFLCFAPHQAQRLMAIHGNPENPLVVQLFNVLYNISGVSYYISTCVNPILYHIMSNRFRQAFRVTMADCLGKGGREGGDSFATMEKNGLSTHHQYSFYNRHQRALSVQQRPLRSHPQQYHSHKNSRTATSFHHYHHHHHHSSSSTNSLQQYIDHLHHQPTTPREDSDGIRPKGTSHTWV